MLFGYNLALHNRPISVRALMLCLVVLFSSYESYRRWLIKNARMSSGGVKFSKYDSVEQVGVAMCEQVVHSALECLQMKKQFSLGVSGGSMTKLLSNLPKLFADNEVLKAGLDNGQVKIFLCDERKVSYESEDSTYGAYKKVWTGGSVDLVSALVPINPDLSLAECASDYEAKMAASTGPSLSLDLALLGIGPDGHTCSLFPAHPLLKESKVGIVPISDSPKPPPERVTLTLPAVRAAAKKIVFATGSGKQPIVKRVLVDGETSDVIPVSLVPSGKQDESVLWLIDGESSKDLNL
ncbi:6-phosphogluconolactonase-like [Symsagittifera roscoffensis]|uniref:6-phosphogluconolactonase-like n=1 Tax=Symsagittifera roscoffensis TaxID=84072 RepID=UPI00307C7267